MIKLTYSESLFLEEVLERIKEEYSLRSSDPEFYTEVEEDLNIAIDMLRRMNMKEEYDTLNNS